MKRLAPLLLGLFGCASTSLAQTGVLVPTQARATSVVAIEGAVGLGPGTDHGGLGVEMRVRSKLGPSLMGASLNAGIFAVGGGKHAEKFFFVGSVGASLFGITRTNERGPVAAAPGVQTAQVFTNSPDYASPYGQFGVGVPIERGRFPLGISASIAAEYNIRRDEHSPNTAYLGLLIGVGWVSYESNKRE